MMNIGYSTELWKSTYVWSFFDGWVVSFISNLISMNTYLEYRTPFPAPFQPKIGASSPLPAGFQPPSNRLPAPSSLLLPPSISLKGYIPSLWEREGYPIGTRD